MLKPLLWAENRNMRLQFTDWPNLDNRSLEKCLICFSWTSRWLGSDFGINNIKTWIHPACISSSGCFWWCYGLQDIFLAHFEPPSTSIVADHVHCFITRVDPSSDGSFQQETAPCHKTHIISNWFLRHTEFAALQWPPDLNWAPLGRGRIAS